MLKIQGDNSHFWQWDTGRRLIVDEPTCTKVYFYNTTTEKALAVDVKDVAGVRVAAVPDLLLQSAFPLTAYVVQCDEDKVVTQFALTFPVYPRPKPFGYISTDDEILTWTSLDLRIKALEEGGVPATRIEESVAAYLEKNPVQAGATAEQAAQIEANKNAIEQLQDETVTDEQIAQAVSEYLEENPVDGVSDEQIARAVSNYLAENPVEGVTDEQIAQAVEDYMAEHGSSSSPNGDGLTAELKNALINYYTHVMPEFDDTNGLAYINAILTALGAETRGESGGDSGGEDEPDDPVSPTVTLSSISATYSGGDVAVGTAVTDLTGIVVTAHYSDGTSKAVTGYTLSGTITEGSNTVTVTYQGKTATFTVTGIAESSGDNNGWTDGEAYAIEWTDGYKLDNSTGEETENTSSSVSDYIPCLGVSALTGAGISGGYLYAYDADKTYLGRIIFDASYPSPVNREVAYVKCYCATNSKDNVSLIPHVYEEMTETTNWEAGKYYSASYVEDTKLDYNTGVTSTHTSNWTSGFMFCYGASNITTTQIIQTSWGNKVAFYDADKNYISGAGGNQVPWEVPENAVYFRLNGFDGFEYTIQKPNRPWIQFA